MLSNGDKKVLVVCCQYFLRAESEGRGNKQRDGKVNSINITGKGATMRRAMMFITLVMVALFTLGVSFLGTAEAGQFKRLTGSNLRPNGGSIQVYASPLNTNTAMEIDVYEFQTTAVADAWRCFVNANNTGQDLTVRLIGLTGAPLATCVTPVNGSCFTPFVNLGAGFLFQCTVSSGAGSPVLRGSVYRVGVQR